MTNFEFYKDEIKAVGYEFGMDKDKAKIEGCSYELCENCKFSKKFTTHYSCVPSRIIWLYSEHVEQPKLTKNERKLCEILNGGYLVRDSSKRLIVYGKKPRKAERWWSVESDNCWKVDIIFDRFKDCNFSFVKWEDEEPWAVSDLLKLEVAECL